MADGVDEWPTGRLLSTAARLVEHAWMEALARHDLTHAGLIVLHLLDGDPLTQRELAERARVEEQTMSRTIERLERSGFVARERDASDGRRRLVTRTPEGAAVFAEADSIEADALPALDDPAAFRAQLIELIGSLSERRW